MSGKREQAYGAPVSTTRRRGHVIAEMPWPQPCAVCRRAARVEIDGERMCRACQREKEGLR